MGPGRCGTFTDRNIPTLELLLRYAQVRLVQTPDSVKRVFVPHGDVARMALGFTRSVPRGIHRLPYVEKRGVGHDQVGGNDYWRTRCIVRQLHIVSYLKAQCAFLHNYMEPQVLAVADLTIDVRLCAGPQAGTVSGRDRATCKPQNEDK